MTLLTFTIPAHLYTDTLYAEVLYNENEPQTPIIKVRTGHIQYDCIKNALCKYLNDAEQPDIFPPLLTLPINTALTTNNTT